MPYFPEERYSSLIDWLPDQLLSFRLDEVRRHFALSASIILLHDSDREDFTVLASDGVPSEPFNGTAKSELSDLLRNVVRTHPKPHIHSCAGTSFAERCERLSSDCKALRKIVYFPCIVDKDAYTYLGMFGAEVHITLSNDLGLAIQENIFTAHVIHRLKQSLTRIKGTEIFMKEIGHDLASSVQSIVSKLRLISDQRVQDAAARNKAKEAEAEINSAWRIADSLGIVGDSEYAISNPADFDLFNVVRSAVEQHRSEASEKHIKIDIRATISTLLLWGEEKAIGIAVGHLLSNAVKYSYGGSEIGVSILRESKDAVISITNKGFPLPSLAERKFIWDFGFRGEMAKELHVNGSGIGLYTVRKVVVAHGGRVVADEQADHITRFRVFLAYPDRLKRKTGFIL